MEKEKRRQNSFNHSLHFLTSIFHHSKDSHSLSVPKATLNNCKAKSLEDLSSPIRQGSPAMTLRRKSISTSEEDTSARLITAFYPEDIKGKKTHSISKPVLTTEKSKSNMHVATSVTYAGSTLMTDNDTAKQTQLINDVTEADHDAYHNASLHKTLLEKDNIHSKCKDCKKTHVHFADTDGRNLVQMQQYCKKGDDRHHLSLNLSEVSSKILVPMFQQPCSLKDFHNLVHANKVSLEKAIPDTDHLGVKGVVRVLNIAFHKDVYIRWSMDQWKSMCDYRIAYMDSAKNSGTDKFRFDICAPLEVGETLEFAVRYECLGKQYWDNNNGRNYKFACEVRQHGMDEKL